MNYAITHKLGISFESYCINKLIESFIEFITRFFKHLNLNFFFVFIRQLLSEKIAKKNVKIGPFSP